MSDKNRAVFTTDVNKIEWKESGSEEWIVPAGIADFTLTFESEDDAIRYLNSKFTSHYITGHDYTIGVNGSRVDGDPGQEMIVSKLFATGTDAQMDVRVTIGKKKQITSTNAVKVTDIGTGETGKVGRFACEFLNAGDDPEVAEVTE